MRNILAFVMNLLNILALIKNFVIDCIYKIVECLINSAQSMQGGAGGESLANIVDQMFLLNL